MVLVCAGCSTSVPEWALDKKTMASVLIEMYIQEARISEMNLSQDSASVLNQLALERTLKEKNIPDSVYQKSYHYYMENLKKFDEVYAIVIDSLKVREAMAAESKPSEEELE